jgi:hypothetical protein
MVCVANVGKNLCSLTETFKDSTFLSQSFLFDTWHMFFSFCDDFFSYLTEQSCYGLPHSSLSYKFNLNMHSGGLILLFLVWPCRNLCLSEIWGDGGAGCNDNNNRYSVVEVKAFFAS